MVCETPGVFLLIFAIVFGAMDVVLVSVITNGTPVKLKIWIVNCPVTIWKGHAETELF